MREKDLLKKLSDKAFIVDLLATFTDQDYLYFVFEYCQHGSLENLIQLIKKAQQPNRKHQAGGITEPLARIYMAQLVNVIEFL